MWSDCHWRFSSKKMLSLSDLSGLQEFAAKAVVLIGSGPANLALADELTRAGIETLLVEGGGSDFSTKSQELYEGLSEGQYHLPYGLAGSRMRFVGGSSNCWAGGCGTLSDIDFEERSWIQNSGWPITGPELKPFYKDAFEFFSISDGQDGSSKRSIGQFELRRLTFTTDLRLKNSKLNQLHSRDNFQLLVGYSLVDLEFSWKKVSAITLKGFDQHTFKLKPKLLVLGCGGIENARLLMNVCVKQNADFFGPALGKYFSEHPIAPVATIIPANDAAEKFLRGFDAASVGLSGVGSVGKFFELPKPVQKQAQIGNVGLQIISDQQGLSDAQMAVAELRSLIKNGALDKVTLESLEKIIMNPVEVIDVLVDRFMRSDSRLSLRFQTEQVPTSDSLIQLSNETDALGLYRTRLKWNISDVERRSVEFATAYFASQIQNAGLGTILLDPFFMETKSGLPSDLRGGQHHCGTTRMGLNERNSVVDVNCRCHKFENLYITGSSVFPTNGWMNPTLTIVALSKRLGRHLVSRLSPAIR